MILNRKLWFAAATVIATALTASSHGASSSRDANSLPPTFYRTAQVDGLTIFYRESGPADGPVVLLLHGFPTSSRMFRNLIPALADRYHVIAPDYPGFGQTPPPDPSAFHASFASYAEIIGALTERLGVNRYALYVQDFGAPVGYRLALAHPERVTALVVQNGNAYEEGLSPFFDPIRAYWADPTDAKRNALRAGLTLEATRSLYVD